MPVDKYIAELVALQRWVKATVNLDSYRANTAPPQLTRPVILWEAPHRNRERSISRWAYVNRVTQYGKLYVKDLGQLTEIQESLLSDLEEKTGLLPVYGASDTVVAWLKRCGLTFDNAENLNVPFNLQYEIAYARTRPQDPPAAAFVGNKVQGGAGVARDYDPAEHND